MTAITGWASGTMMRVKMPHSLCAVDARGLQQLVRDAEQLLTGEKDADRLRREGEDQRPVGIGPPQPGHHREERHEDDIERQRQRGDDQDEQRALEAKIELGKRVPGHQRERNRDGGPGQGNEHAVGEPPHKTGLIEEQLIVPQEEILRQHLHWDRIELAARFERRAHHVEERHDRQENANQENRIAQDLRPRVPRAPIPTVFMPASPSSLLNTPEQQQLHPGQQNADHGQRVRRSPPRSPGRTAESQRHRGRPPASARRLMGRPG